MFRYNSKTKTKFSWYSKSKRFTMLNNIKYSKFKIKDYKLTKIFSHDITISKFIETKIKTVKKCII